jgi:predicted MPP superfamily phosphohydrolase
MDKLSLQRKAIETGHLEAWLTPGKGSFHLENINSLKPLLRFLLKSTGLYNRGIRNALTPVINRTTFAFEDLPAGFDGYTIMHLSDIHIDASEKLAGILINMISGLSVDLCVMTGDYRFEIYGPSDNVFDDMERVISKIEAKDGIIGILGNHDFAETTPALEKMGVKMLMNDSVRIQRRGQEIAILGVDDPHYYGCHDLKSAITEVPESVFKVLLAHTPELYVEALENHIKLYLCGHTHGGQIRLPLFGPIITNAACPRRMVMGKWQYANLRGYTNSGFGFSMAPVRFNCPPEICLITLKTDKA